MNELIEKFLTAKDGETVTLERGKTYDVYDDDCLLVKGLYCSNTATKEENPEGIRRTAMYLDGKKNIVVDGNGATVLIHGVMTPFVFTRCENITVKNLTVDYARPTMNEFTVLENNDGVCLLKINPESQFEIRGDKLVWVGEKKSDGSYRWENTYKNENTLTMYLMKGEERLFFVRGEEGDCRPSVPTFSSLERIDEYTVKAVMKNKQTKFPVGATVQSRVIVRDQLGGFFERCKNLLFEGLRICFMHGLGMLSQYCENVTYRNCDCTPKEGRTFTSNADFFQFSGCKGEIVVENNKAYGSHDDFINVHGTHLRVVEQNEEEKSVVVRFMHNQSWGFQAFDVGDEIEFIHSDTLIPYGKNCVKRVERLGDTDIKLYLDAYLPPICVGKDVVENCTWTPNLTVKGNYFGYSAARGVLCTTRGNVLIENNTFYKNAGAVLLVADDCNFWFESGYTRNVVFRNNKVIHCGFGNGSGGSKEICVLPEVIGESSEFVHESLKIIGNEFLQPCGGKHVWELRYLRSAHIEENSFDGEWEIQAKVCGDIVKKNNKEKVERHA